MIRLVWDLDDNAGPRVADPGLASFAAEGMFLAQYQVLRENGHSPSEAFNETVEEATQSLFVSLTVWECL